MSTHSTTIPSGAGLVSGAAAPAAPKTAREARAGVWMSLATFAMAAASAIQAVLYLSQFGTDGRTDGFFVAFAFYTTFGVFSQSLRLTSVPLLVQPHARMTIRQYAAVLGLIAVPVLLATVVLADPMSQLLAPGLSAGDRHVTESALPILGLATVLQLWAAGGATVLAIRDRFIVVAGAYIAGAGAGLAAYLGLRGASGELTLGWSMLTMAIVTFAWMAHGLRRSGGLGPRGGSLRLPRLVTDAGVVLGRTAVYLAFNVLFLVTLSSASHSAAGDATVLSYAYLFASYLVAGTGMALGMGRITEMTRGAREERRKVVRETVPQGFRYAMLLVAPALAGLVTAGAPLIHELFPSSLDAHGVHLLRVFGALLAAWTVAALLVNFLLPAMFALGRARFVNLLAIPLVVLHVVATLIGSALLGVQGAVGAFFVAPFAFGIVLLVVGAEGVARDLAREMARDSLRPLLLSAVAFGAAEAVAITLTSGLATAVVAGALGSAFYAAAAALFARRQILVLYRTLAPASS
jgi:peptidoglycan biosynthesis protein MviN/MurJ (putative lipid II flippase)